MFRLNFVFIVGFMSLGSVLCILTPSKPSEASEKSDVKKTDSVVAQSIDRDYIAGFEGDYGAHGGYGLSAHANYGFSDGHEGFGVIEGHKHHIHLPEEHQHHHHDHHKHYDYAHHKALAIKSLLVPLAGVALLGAAAAFVSNPILLQLGVISGSTLGRRKRSATTSVNDVTLQEERTKLKEIKLLERFITQIPREDIQTQEKKMLANYLSCSGLTTGNHCLERLACELQSTEGTSMPMEADVLTIVVNEIFDNRFIPEETKLRLSRAVDRGKNNFGCEVYECEQLENGQG